MPARISFYRPTGQSRRQARPSNHDHDVFDGLPVRRWEKQEVMIGKPLPPPPPPPPDLPMPKDSHLLSATSLALLQAARASPVVTDPTDKPDPANALFKLKRWVQIPKDQEPPEPVYLARIPGDEGDKKEIALKEDEAALRRKMPPPAKKSNRKGKARGRKPGSKKSVSFAEGAPVTPVPPAAAAAQGADMMEIDAATKENPVPVNPVAQEVEKAELRTEAIALEKKAAAESQGLPPPHSLS
ncbi:hypothetical protein EDC01DRAFT_4251 [Geopyxis carbonaria]|nr:hypothetical protein EDC01DRAFT_4251 [Geopyxis carbonaria]